MTGPGLRYPLLLTQRGLAPVHGMLTERACTRRRDRKRQGSSLGDPDTDPGSVAALSVSSATVRTLRRTPNQTISRTGDLWRAAPRTMGRRESLFTERIPSHAPPDTGPEHAVPGAAPDTKTRSSTSGLCLLDPRSPPAQAVTALRVQSC